MTDIIDFEHRKRQQLQADVTDDGITQAELDAYNYYSQPEEIKFSFNGDIKELMTESKLYLKKNNIIEIDFEAREQVPTRPEWSNL